MLYPFLTRAFIGDFNATWFVTWFNYIVLLSGRMFIQYKTPKQYKEYIRIPFVWGTYTWMWLMVIIIVVPEYPGNDLPVWPFALASAVMCAAALFFAIAEYKSLSDILEKSKARDAMFADLG
jgi:hypothetical protein